MKPIEVTVKNSEELMLLMDKGDYEISKSLVENILINLKTKKKRIHVISVFCEEDNEIYDLTLERNNFLDTLEKNLEMFERHENYEGCAKILEAISQLKSS
jgi:hypothetical protein